MTGPGSISSSPQPDLSGLGHVLLLSVLSLSQQRDKGEQSIKEKNSHSFSRPPGIMASDA